MSTVVESQLDREKVSFRNPKGGAEMRSIFNPPAVVAATEKAGIELIYTNSVSTSVLNQENIFRIPRNSQSLNGENWLHVEMAAPTGEVDAILTITPNNIPDQQRYRLVYRNYVTGTVSVSASLAYNANAAALKAELEALDNWVTGDTVTFSGDLTAAATCTFVLANNANNALITARTIEVIPEALNDGGTIETNATYYVTTLSTAGVASGYFDYPGLNLITRIEINLPGKYNINFDYRTVMEDCMARMTADEKAQLLVACGGTSPSGATEFVVPLPLPWSHLVHDKTKKYNPPMALGLIADGAAEIKLFFNSAANLCNGTVGALSTILLVSEVVRTSSEDWNALKAKRDSGGLTYPGFTFRTRQSSANAVSTASPTDVTLNFLHGFDVQSLCVSPKLSTSLGSGGNAFLNQDADSYELILDGSRIWDARYKSINKYQDFLHRKNYDSVLGNPILIKFNADAEAGDSDYSGGLVVRSSDDFRLQDMTHTVGADVQFDICARIHSHLIIDSNGNVSEHNKF